MHISILFVFKLSIFLVLYAHLEFSLEFLKTLIPLCCNQGNGHLRTKDRISARYFQESSFRALRNQDSLQLSIHVPSSLFPSHLQLSDLLLKATFFVPHILQRRSHKCQQEFFLLSRRSQKQKRCTVPNPLSRQ